MPIIGFNFDKIQVERIKKIEGNVEVKNNLGIKDIELEKIPLTNLDEVLKFVFEFSLNYEPGIGNITINGHILYTDNQKNIKEIVKNWKKDKKITTPLLQTLLNNVLHRCHIRSLALAQEVNLPTHLNLPMLQAAKPEKDYIG